MTSAPNDDPIPSPEDIDALLAFLPLFEADGFVFGEMHSEPGAMPYFEGSDTAVAFHDAAYEHGWVIDFDWMAWGDEARVYETSPDRLSEADLATVRRLLTTHVRADRFCEGHLGAVFESGHLVAILRRLAVIRRGLGDAGSGGAE